jgi:para-aminobenzoate synthetase component I
MVWFSYDLCRWIEPSVVTGALARPRAVRDRGWPLAELHRCDSAVVFADGAMEQISGMETSREQRRRGFSCGTFDVSSRKLYTDAVAQAIERIRAGDIFQVNLAHRLSAPFAGCSRDAFLTLCARADPWHGAYMESWRPSGEQHAILCASPELFLEIDRRAGTIRARPMKGTRPPDADPGELERSEKDRAELNMITDLMRNDLGRVAALCSVRVSERRAIERHAGPRGILQATAEVCATLRPGASWRDILAATFPPGSVTGAPKIRAMQIIDELEPVRRGPYCGAIGFIGDDGRARLSVAIRTACITGRGPSPGLFERGALDYSVGAGIVSDSDPGAEWAETLEKAAILDALRGPRDAVLTG